jgi:hypothetical protein
VTINVKLLGIIIAGHLAYIALAFFTPREALVEGINAFTLLVASCVVFAFAPLFWRTLTSHAFAPVDLMSVGIFTAWMVIALTRVFAMINWYLLGRSVPIDGAYVMTYLFTLGNIGGFCHLAARVETTLHGDADHLEVYRNGLFLVGAMVAFAIAFSIA